MNERRLPSDVLWIAKLLEIVRAIEWAGDPRLYLCPMCFESRQAGHTPTCRLGVVLNAAKGYLAKGYSDEQVNTL